MKTETLFSHSSDEWSTPQDLFNQLDSEFNFTLDPCATEENHKCEKWYSMQQDGLKQDWGGESVFCNPPYSEVSKWVEKAYREGCKDNTTVVLLVFSRTDTKWFHNYCLYRAEIRFLKGRIKFGNAQYNAPFPNMIIIFRGAVTNENRQKGKHPGSNRR